MPRKSPHTIDLTTDERSGLESLARRYTPSYYAVARAKIVLLAAQGLGNDVIARRLDVGRQVVSRWRKRLWGLDVSKRCHTAAAVDKDGQLRLKDFGFDDDAVGRFGMRVWRR